MRAIDTNVLVRFLTKDDERQYQAARRLIEAGRIFISLTVLLECEWVLRNAYRYSTQRILDALELVAGLPGIALEDPMIVATAIDWTRSSMDFADALHLANIEGCTAFISFDKKLAKIAKGRSPIPVETP